MLYTKNSLMLLVNYTQTKNNNKSMEKKIRFVLSKGRGWGFPGGSDGKESACNRGAWV